MIHVQSMEKSYKEVHVLRSADFDVARGSPAGPPPDERHPRVRLRPNVSWRCHQPGGYVEGHIPAVDSTGIPKPPGRDFDSWSHEHPWDEPVPAARAAAGTATSR